MIATLDKKRAQGMPGAGRTHGPPATKKQAAVTTGLAETPLELKRSSQHSLDLEVAMTIRRKRSTRAPLGSLGRPSVAGRAEQEMFWRAIATGLSIEAAALRADVSEAIGSRLFRKAGGMPPAMFRSSAKPPSGRYLSLAERVDISLLNAQGYSMREIGRRLKRAASTISRELDRNAATHAGGMAYRAISAQWHADRSARRPKPTKLARDAALRTYVEDRLAGVVAAPSCARVRRSGPRKDRRPVKAWSPEQIARRLPIDFPDDETMRISHEAIYQALYIQGRGALRRELAACLRTGRALRVPRARAGKRSKGFIPPEIMISERPAEVADRAVPGHWEGDLIVGAGSSAIGTLVERTTRFTMLLHLPRLPGHGQAPRDNNGLSLSGHGAEAVRDAITRTILTLPEELRRSLTWDQGSEMAQHSRLKIDTGIQIYFCDPRSPWQRGTNENTNGLLRQYFPKGTDLSTYDAEDISAVAAALNGRPRKTLGWKTPAEALDELMSQMKRKRTGVATTV
jgi:IS30 family transposase